MEVKNLTFFVECSIWN